VYEEYIQRAWKTIEEIQKSGKALSIGASGYSAAYMEKTLKVASSPPVINDIFYHPYLDWSGDGYIDIEWLQKYIQVGSFKHLAPVLRKPENRGPLQEPLASIAERHGVSVPAVLIRWIIQQGIAAIATTTNLDTLHAYIQALAMKKLEDDEMKKITDVGASALDTLTTEWSKIFADDESWPKT